MTKTGRTLTKDDVETIVSNSSRCTQATLLAFGIKGYPFYGPGCLNYLRKDGYETKEDQDQKGRALSECIFQGGVNYIIFTKGHVMAYVDGLLVDTMKKNLDGRIVENIFEVIWHGKNRSKEA